MWNKSVDQFNSIILSIFHCRSQFSSNYIKKLLSLAKPMYHHNVLFWILYNIHSFDRGKMFYLLVNFWNFCLSFVWIWLSHGVPEDVLHNIHHNVTCDWLTILRVDSHTPTRPPSVAFTSKKPCSVCIPVQIIVFWIEVIWNGFKEHSLEMW